MSDTSSGGTSYAGFWIRVGACIMWMRLLFWPCRSLLFRSSSPATVDETSGMSCWAQSCRLPDRCGHRHGAYVGSACESSAKQATLGKMALGLKVTSVRWSARRLSLGQAAVRAWPFYLASGLAGAALDALVGTGMILSSDRGRIAAFDCAVSLIAFSPIKQGLHDMMACSARRQEVGLRSKPCPLQVR